MIMMTISRILTLGPVVMAFLTIFIMSSLDRLIKVVEDFIGDILANSQTKFWPCQPVSYALNCSLIEDSTKSCTMHSANSKNKDLEPQRPLEILPDKKESDISKNALIKRLRGRRSKREDSSNSSNKISHRLIRLTNNNSRIVKTTVRNSADNKFIIARYPCD